jgi:hypothetical protein
MSTLIWDWVKNHWKLLLILFSAVVMGAIAWRLWSESLRRDIDQAKQEAAKLKGQESVYNQQAQVCEDQANLAAAKAADAGVELDRAAEQLQREKQTDSLEQSRRQQEAAAACEDADEAERLLRGQ